MIHTNSLGSLSGVRVVEVGAYIAGPFCGHLFADHGAEVIKIEPPGEGDLMRRWGGMYRNIGLYWSIISRNKRSITLDLRSPESQDVVHRLVREADVLLENFRPGTLERWGLGPNVLLTHNPALVVIRVSGYGQTGPYRDKAGFGAIGEAMGGMRYLTGEPDGLPVRVAVSLGDALAATHAFVGGLLALYSRDRPGGSGRGQVVDVAIYEAVWAYMESILPDYDKLGLIRERSGPILPKVAPSSVYPTSDGQWLLIGANAETVFRRFAEATGHGDWLQDSRFSGHVARGEHQAELDDLIVGWTRQRTLDEVLEIMERAGVPAGRIYSAADIANDPHYHAREMIISVPEPNLGGEHVRMQGVVPKLSRTPGRVKRGGPLLGEHNDEVYRGLLGLTEAQLARLREQGVI